MCVGSSPVTSEMISASTGARDAAARRPPWIAERCLRTVFISWIAAPLLSSWAVTFFRSAIGTSGAGSGYVGPASGSRRQMRGEDLARIGGGDRGAEAFLQQRAHCDELRAGAQPNFCRAASGPRL